MLIRLTMMARVLAFLPTTALATTNWCNCVPGSWEEADGPGGCTLVRKCEKGFPGGICLRKTQSFKNDDGTITFVVYDGKWGLWKEFCPDDASNLSELELLFENLSQ